MSAAADARSFNRRLAFRGFDPRRFLWSGRTPPLQLQSSPSSFRRMNGRLIAIGDIHGCHAEFTELLEQLAVTRDDRLVLLGDLVNRGPDSCKVLDLARAYR